MCIFVSNPIEMVATFSSNNKQPILSQQIESSNFKPPSHRLHSHICSDFFIFMGLEWKKP